MTENLQVYRNRLAEAGDGRSALLIADDLKRGVR